jgi:hypothetical protein
VRNPKIDSYIDSAPDYAAPIIIHLRELTHKAFLKLRKPLNGEYLILAQGFIFGIAAHKNHASVMSHKSNLLSDKSNLINFSIVFSFKIFEFFKSNIT